MRKLLVLIQRDRTSCIIAGADKVDFFSHKEIVLQCILF